MININNNLINIILVYLYINIKIYIFILRKKSIRSNSLRRNLHDLFPPIQFYFIILFGKKIKKIVFWRKRLAVKLIELHDMFRVTQVYIHRNMSSPIILFCTTLIKHNYKIVRKSILANHASFLKKIAYSKRVFVSISLTNRSVEGSLSMQVS